MLTTTPTSALCQCVPGRVLQPLLTGSEEPDQCPGQAGRGCVGSLSARATAKTFLTQVIRLRAFKPGPDQAISLREILKAAWHYHDVRLNLPSIQFLFFFESFCFPTHHALVRIQCLRLLWASRLGASQLYSKKNTTTCDKPRRLGGPGRQSLAVT